MATILVVGSGGREHALCWRARLEGHEVHAAPGSDAIEAEATRHAIAVDDHAGLIALARAKRVDLVIVGPEQPLVDGLADQMRAAGLFVFGPSAQAAELEGSKAAAKAFMQQHQIPTARHETVFDLQVGLEALRRFDAPPVVKADGLAAGKGVTVPDTFEEAEQALRACLGAAPPAPGGTKVVLEERLYGQEVSLFVLTDGVHAATFLPAQDHKRIGEGDTGPNTGGMGAYVPAPVYTPQVHARAMDRIVRPTLAGLHAQRRPFVGVLFVGLMIDEAGDPKVVEYNCRFGDPEAQPLVFGLQEPLVPHLLDATRGQLREGVLQGRPAATVVLASAGYPASSRRGDRVRGLQAAATHPDVQVFHAGTRRSDDGGWETAGGRVLGVCARADDLREALRRAYAAADEIAFDGMQLRRDIGARAVGRA
jgi:phosphoribosylamine---glycine ligase